MGWVLQDYLSSGKTSYQLQSGFGFCRNHPLSLGSTADLHTLGIFDGRGRVLTSWLLCSMARSSSQDLYSSMPSLVLRTSCGLSMRQGSPSRSTDSTAVAQLLSEILPEGKRDTPLGHRWGKAQEKLNSHTQSSCC